MKLYPKRESVNPEIGDVLSIYDKDNNILAKSDTYAFDQDIYLEYDDLLYMADKNGDVWIGFKSITNKFGLT